MKQMFLKGRKLLGIETIKEVEVIKEVEKGVRLGDSGGNLFVTLADEFTFTDVVKNDREPNKAWFAIYKLNKNNVNYTLALKLADLDGDFKVSQKKITLDKCKNKAYELSMTSSNVVKGGVPC